MRKAITFTMVFFAVAFVSASATIINIPDDYPTIQQGIDASIDGDTVLVQPGTYVENINFNLKNIVVGSLFLTTGDTSYISQTIIDGDSSGSVITISHGQVSTSLITGFTIQHGNAPYGGGVYCNNNSSPTIANNRIIENTATYDGGGIWCYDQSNPRISGNLIAHNTSLSGGGIFCESASNPVIIDNVISENVSEYEGGGITCYRYASPTIINNYISENNGGLGGGIFCGISSHPNIEGNIINQNTSHGGGGISCIMSSDPTINANIINSNMATNYGGGISCSDSDPIISFNTISENSADSGGGALSCWRSDPIVSFNILNENSAHHGGAIFCFNSYPTIDFNTIFGNSAYRGGGVLSEGCSPLIKNTIFWANNSEEGHSQIGYIGNYPVVLYCDVESGWEGEGNIDCDPFFCDPETDNFYLAENSCCVGAGENGEDIGALGVGCEPTAVGEEQPLPFEYSLYQNYPNPFNASTIIRYSLPSESNVTISIYNLLGRRIETLMQGEQPAGYHQITWDASDHSSGMYFYRIQAGDYAETRKMVLLK